MTGWYCLSGHGLCCSARELLPGAASVGAAVVADVFVAVCTQDRGLGLVADWVCCGVLYMFSRFIG